MQYLLTKNEYDELAEAKQHRLALDIARDRLLFHARFQCIHDGPQHTYCTECPANYGRMPGRLICTRERNYPK